MSTPNPSPEYINARGVDINQVSIVRPSRSIIRDIGSADGHDERCASWRFVDCINTLITGCDGNEDAGVLGGCYGRVHGSGGAAAERHADHRFGL